MTCTLAASSHISLQYLLSFVGGQVQVSRAHLFSLFSSAILITILLIVFFLSGREDYA